MGGYQGPQLSDSSVSTSFRQAKTSDESGTGDEKTWALPGFFFAR
jgi:hypothetical protein